MKNTWLSLAALALGVALSLGACGDDDDDSPTGGTGGTGGRAGSGTGGSGTGGSGTGGSGTGGSGTGGSGGGAMGAGGGAGTGGAAGTGGSAGQGGGGSGGAAGTGGAPPTSFAAVLDRMTSAGTCLGCHSVGLPAGPSGGLVITYDSLRNGTTPNGCATYPKYVDTTDVNKSFLLAKLDPNIELPSGCGTKMPPPPPETFDLVLVDLVRQWILDGANP